MKIKNIDLDNNFKRDIWVVCINDEGFFHPKFELEEGQLYLIHDVKITKSLFSKPNVKFIFLADDGSSIEINAKRFKKVSNL